MFNEWSYGLGDNYTDCLTAVGQRGTQYIFAGAELQYTATVDLSADLNRLKEQLVSPNFASVSVTSMVAPIAGISRVVLIKVISAIDRASLFDVQYDLDQLTQSIRHGASSIALTYRPSSDEICAVWKGGLPPAKGTPTGDSQQKPPGKCEAKQGLDWVACELGFSATADIVQWAVIGIIGIVAAKSFLR